MKAFVVLAFVGIILGASAMTRRQDATVDCFRNIKSITAILPRAIVHAQNLDINSLIMEGQNAKELLSQTAKHCATTQWLQYINQTTIQGPAECIQDILNLVPAIQQLIVDLNSGNLTAIINDIQNLIPQINQTIAHCTEGKKVDFTHLINYFDTQECRAIALEKREVFLTMMYAVGGRNYAQGIQVLPEFIDALMHVLQTCSVAKQNTHVNFMEMSASVPAAESNGCIDDLAAIAQLIPQLLEHIRAGNVAAVIQDAQTLFKLVEQAAQDCKRSVKQINPMDYVNATTANDIAKCIQDIVNLIPGFQQLVQDLATGNLTAIIQDIQNLVPQINQTISDCSQLKPRRVQHLINFYKDAKCISKIQEAQYTVLAFSQVLKMKDTVRIAATTPKVLEVVSQAIKTCSKRRMMSA